MASQKPPCSILSILTLKTQNDKGSELTHNSTISLDFWSKIPACVGECSDLRRPSLRLLLSQALPLNFSRGGWSALAYFCSVLNFPWEELKTWVLQSEVGRRVRDLEEACFWWGKCLQMRGTESGTLVLAHLNSSQANCMQKHSKSRNTERQASSHSKPHTSSFGLFSTRSTRRVCPG